MPQELHIVQCFNCETYQVDIVKKVPKWRCKLCGEKQSVKKIYGKGSGKECRLFVQSLNEQRLTKVTVPTTVELGETVVAESQTESACFNKGATSKWDQFVSPNEKSKSCSQFQSDSKSMFEEEKNYDLESVLDL